MNRKYACMLTALTFAVTGSGLHAAADAESTKDIEKSIEWALATAADDTHGYSQADRWGPDYDCSSFVIEALREGGFQTGFAVTTKNMKQELTKNGFTWISWDDIVDESGLLRGDVLLNEQHHTEIYLGGGRKVGAHSAGMYYDDDGIPITGDQDGNEISENDYKFASWDGVLRYIRVPFEGISPSVIDTEGYIRLYYGEDMIIVSGEDLSPVKTYEHKNMFFKLNKTSEKVCTVENMQGEFLTVSGDEDVCFAEAVTDSETQSFYICDTPEGKCIRPVCRADKALTMSGSSIILADEQEGLKGQLFSFEVADDYYDDHIWSDWDILTPADSEHEGLKEHTCTVCGHTEQKVIPIPVPPAEPPEKDILFGDTDGSGKIDIVDAVMVISHINGISPLNEEQSKRADIDGEKGISITDAVTIIGYINGTLV